MARAKNITKKDSYTLIGLRQLAQKHLKALCDIQETAADITDEISTFDGKREKYGLTSDWIMGDDENIETLLENLDIRITDA